MRIMVTGKHGQVVSALIERGAASGESIVTVGRPELDFWDSESVKAAIASTEPDVIVSAAAYTAVDKAESEPIEAFAVNADGPKTVAEVARTLGVPVIHLSTDYVFAGDKNTPYVEDDDTGPTSVYGRSKLAGEHNVAAATADHVILRTAWVYSPFGANFIKTMLRLSESHDYLRVVADQYGTPTSALDIADAVLTIANRLRNDHNPALRGVFHLTGSGSTTWAHFAEAIFTELEKRTGKKVTVEHIPTANYPTPASRPKNSRLSNDKLEKVYGIQLPDWRRSTAVVLERLFANV